MAPRLEAHFRTPSHPSSPPRRPAHHDRDALHFLSFLLGYARRLRGEERDLVRQMARPYLPRLLPCLRQGTAESRGNAVLMLAGMSDWKSSASVYPRMRDLLTLLVIAIAENVGYRQLSIWWRLRGMLSKFRRATVRGAMERKGFASTEEDDEPIE